MWLLSYSDCKFSENIQILCSGEFQTVVGEAHSFVGEVFEHLGCLALIEGAAEFLHYGVGFV